MKSHVASDIISDSTFIAQKNLKSQTYLQNLSTWTENQKIKSNEEKTKAMLFNFTNNYQFSTRTKLNDRNVEVIDRTTLSGRRIQFFGSKGKYKNVTFEKMCNFY